MARVAAFGPRVGAIRTTSPRRCVARWAAPCECNVTIVFAWSDGRPSALCGAGAALPRALRALRVAHARLPRRGRGCGAGRAGARLRSAGGLPRAGQVCGVAVPDLAEPLLRGAATPAARRTAAR